MTLPTRPLTPAPAQDLTDAEFVELDELLAATPEPLEPVDVVMLDGYLCGVLVQPVLLEPAAWLTYVYDFDGRPLPDDVDPAWLQRTQALILRRHSVLNRALAEDGWFDPLVLDVDESDGNGDGNGEAEAGAETQAGDSDASAGDAGAAEPAAPPSMDDEDEPVDADPISQALMPWVVGFQHATVSFPDLLELPDEEIMLALARLYRHLPAETDDEREVAETLQREYPLATLDDAIDDVVATVADLYELTSEQRYRVDTVRRETPKVGRNDPCPCGSGKKYKQCHGA